MEEIERVFELSFYNHDLRPCSDPLPVNENLKKIAGLMDSEITRVGEDYCINVDSFNLFFHFDVHTREMKRLTISTNGLAIITCELSDRELMCKWMHQTPRLQTAILSACEKIVKRHNNDAEQIKIDNETREAKLKEHERKVLSKWF